MRSKEKCIVIFYNNFNFTIDYSTLAYALLVVIIQTKLTLRQTRLIILTPLDFEKIFWTCCLLQVSAAMCVILVSIHNSENRISH
jgi:hypothetical protein